MPAAVVSRRPVTDRTAGDPKGGARTAGELPAGQGIAGEGPTAEELVALARTGNEEAWEALYARAYPRLLAYARRRLPTVEHARDAVAETMTRAVAGIDRWAGEGAGFDAWLYGIARHVVIDTQRTAHRESPAWGDALPGDDAQLPDHRQPHDGLLQTEDTERLRAAYAGLSLEEQEILELRVVAGLPAEQVANALGRRPGAIRMAQSRALDRLRQLLHEQERRLPERARVGSPSTVDRRRMAEPVP